MSVTTVVSAVASIRQAIRLPVQTCFEGFLLFLFTFQHLPPAPCCPVRDSTPKMSLKSYFNVVKSAPLHSVPCQTRVKPSRLLLQFPVSLSACFPCLRKGWQIFKENKEKGKSFLFIDAWMTSSTDRKVRGAGREEHTQSECLCTCIMHTSLQSYVCRKTSTPHLPRYQHIVSPDKLEWVRACWFLTLQVSVTFLSELHVVSHQDKES